MFIKLGVILFVVQITTSQKESSEWDLAVATNDQVELLYSNGSLLGSAVQQFNKLKALTFDSIRHQFLVSDVDQKNDTIYSVQLTKPTDVIPIVTNLPDDVKGLAIDPITDILYWADSLNKSIKYISLKDPLHESKVFLQFDNQNPHGISIDVCRRYIYWTNSDIDNPTIERASLDNQTQEVIVSNGLYMPTGITVDQFAQRIVWADKREGIYYRIESSNLDGSQREVLHEGTHQRPFGVAVDAEAVYWTDINNNALWRKKKRIEEHPEKLRHFKENPFGLVSNKLVKNITECTLFFDVKEHYNGPAKEYFKIEMDYDDKDEVIHCLNGGEIEEDGCKCKRGFTGDQCEISLCNNYCLRGNCHISSIGYPQCRCPLGFVGSRCERNLCDNFCLNDGECFKNSNSTFGVGCQCQDGYFGRRCEMNFNAKELCDIFCKEKRSDVLMSENNKLICRCDEGSFNLLKDGGDLTAYELVGDHPSILNHFRDPGFLVLSACMLVMLVLIITLSIIVCKLRRRPRIKKRIIVNKNVTPLTYRPQPNSQQCEITIENCCNMNVCETPCFEPPQLRGFQVSKKEEKKTLLSNIENGEDLY